MKGKVVVIVVALMAMAMLVAPVMATSKVPCTAVITDINYVDPNIQYVVTDDGILHLLYFKFGGTIDLSDGVTTITVNWMDTCTGMYNPKTNRGLYVFNEVWTDPITGGTFVGMDHPRTAGDLLASFGVPTGNPPSTSIEGHIIAHGTGAFAGQALEITLTPETYPVFVGTWLKPPA